ncbi:unnamed protein product [Prorocentrum cordatum]|uniref:Uncharacterized protein n=1 Tax=Prorocentrum cordatum TaxID=2364126 RepID=A0ABN9Q1A8_9DINO|nr:unnamed protein product [Polarella glacialis]
MEEAALDHGLVELDFGAWPATPLDYGFHKAPTTRQHYDLDGRVFLWTRGFYKDYDCRTSLCYCCCWCACAYVFLRDELLLLERAPSTMSFMTLPSVFSTETRVDPAILCDPIHPPWRLPCWEALCTGCTRWARCQTLFLSG